MTHRTTACRAGLCLVSALCLPASCFAGAETAAPRPPARVYTNEDLDRVHPFREETGVASVPATHPDASPPEPRPRARSRGEEYWRREAARVRERVAALEAQAADLRQRIADLDWERRHVSRRASATAASPDERLRSRLAGVERRIRRLEDDLRERARREGALPGWLR